MCQKKRNHMQLYNSDILAVPSICIHTTFLYVNRCKYICIYVHIYQKKHKHTYIYIHNYTHTYTCQLSSSCLLVVLRLVFLLFGHLVQIWDQF